MNHTETQRLSLLAATLYRGVLMIGDDLRHDLPAARVTELHRASRIVADLAWSLGLAIGRDTFQHFDDALKAFHEGIEAAPTPDRTGSFKALGELLNHAAAQPAGSVRVYGELLSALTATTTGRELFLVTA